jgi:hypothetical protein
METKLDSVGKNSWTNVGLKYEVRGVSDRRGPMRCLRQNFVSGTGLNLGLSVIME